MSDPKVIYLQPECCADPELGRLWSETPGPVDCEDGKPWVKYTMADVEPSSDAAFSILVSSSEQMQMVMDSGRIDFSKIHLQPDAFAYPTDLYIVGGAFSSFGKAEVSHEAGDWLAEVQ